MVNPANGIMTRYEECWVDVGVLGIDGGDDKGKSDGWSKCGQGGDGGNVRESGSKDKWSVVLVLEDDEQHVRGMVVRVGQFCQGILRVRDEVSVERWQWQAVAPAAAGGEWKRVAKLGRLFLPCAMAFEPDRIVEGSKVQYGDYGWVVKEVYGW